MTAFRCICDVEGELYKALGLGSAADREELGRNPIPSLKRLPRPKEAGLVHGEDSGNPLQYPGPFCHRPGRSRYRYAFRADAPARSALAGRRSQRSLALRLTVLHTYNKGRETIWFLSLFSQFTGYSGDSSR